MNRSRRGYISFLFMMPLALLLLAPLFLLQGSENSLTSIHISNSALSEQVSLKRALVRAAHTAILEKKDNTADALISSAVVFGAPEVKIADIAFDALSEEKKLQVVRYNVLRRWATLLQQWNQNSDYTAHLYCGQTEAGASVEFDYEYDTSILGSSSPPSPSWQACSQFITRDPQLTALSRPYRILPGFFISVEHRYFNYSAAGPLRPQEVGS